MESKITNQKFHDSALPLSVSSKGYVRLRLHLGLETGPSRFTVHGSRFRFRSPRNSKRFMNSMAWRRRETTDHGEEPWKRERRGEAGAGPLHSAICRLHCSPP